MQNKRCKPRFPISTTLRIGDVVAGQLPASKALYPVFGVDLSRTGIALAAHDAIDVGTELVLELGRRPKLTYLVAQVVCCEPSDLFGTPAFRIGCEFIARAAPDTSGQLQRLEGVSPMLGGMGMD